MKYPSISPSRSPESDSPQAPFPQQSTPLTSTCRIPSAYSSPCKASSSSASSLPSSAASFSGAFSSPSSSPRHTRQRHTAGRLFTRCRVFLIGIFLGCFFTQSFTTSLSLCVVDNDMKGIRHPLSSVFMMQQGFSALRKEAHEMVDEFRKSQRGIHSAAPNNKKWEEHTDDAWQAAFVDQDLWPIEIQPGNYSKVRDFQKQPHVVIATKIHGPDFVSQLKQSMCLLKAAYNNRVLYDIIVFTTTPLSDYDTRNLMDIVHPANLRIETDSLTLQDQIKAMTRLQRLQLKKRCQVNSTDDLFWWTRCCEDGATGTCMSLAYTWQSEFRAKHLWTHPALQPYKTMMWFDSDAMPTRVWTQDPVAVFLRNQLKILFAHFPQGKSAGEDLREKIVQAFNETLCILKLRNGHFFSKGGTCLKPIIPNIHGFFHVTDLDFYRSPENLGWFNILIGDSKFSRRWDDQIAVTIPAAIRTPDLAWEMEALGVKNDVWHNQYLDGKYRWRGGGYQSWWKVNGTRYFPKAQELCSGLITNSG